MEVQAGQVCALLGNNGAGKSTLANIISGELAPDSGNIFIDNEKVEFSSPKAARLKGIYYVHQVPMVSELLTIEENIRIGLNREERKNIDVLLEKWLPDTRKKTSMKNAGPDTRFFCALINSLLHNPKILILDEPSSLLDDKQREFLFENLTNFAKEGRTVLVISHNLEEVKRFCSEVFYLKDGTVKKVEKEDLGTGLKENEIELRTGLESLGTGLIEKKLCISFKNLSGTSRDGVSIKNLSFECKAGQVSIIHGTNEDGLLTLESILTLGDLSCLCGTMEISTETSVKTIDLSKHSLTPLILRTKLGIKTGIIPTDRKYTGSNPELTIKELLTEGKNKPSDFCKKLINAAEVDINEWEKVKSLSGGMLQRLIIERELEKNPEFLILSHPMQGLAPEICNKIEKRIREAASDGTAVLILTSGDFIGQFGDGSHFLIKGEFAK